jgi:hypothetical protein
MSGESVPELLCAICNKPIVDVDAALAHKISGGNVHFDCALTELSGHETLEAGDRLSYIGGGRFGVVHAENPDMSAVFTIKKIIEWENKDERAPWRRIVAEHYSNT